MKISLPIFLAITSTTVLCAQVVTLTAAEDHQCLMDLLHMTTIRHGADGSHPEAPNYDESRANPDPDLPDPLVLKNGKKVTTEVQETRWQAKPPAPPDL